MLTVSSLVGVRKTLHIPSSNFRRRAASSKRAAAASQGFFSFSSDMETGAVDVATSWSLRIHLIKRQGAARLLHRLWRPGRRMTHVGHASACPSEQIGRAHV